MDWENFESNISRAFCGQGGAYFKENYQQSFYDKNRTLLSIVKELKSDLKLELEDPKLYDNNFEDEIDRMKELYNREVNTDQECYKFFCSYLDDSFGSFPELCGIIVGIMARIGMLEEALEISGVNNIGENEEVQWDS